MSTNKKFDVRAILSISSVYSLFSKLIIPEPWQPDFVRRYMRLEPGMRVLDLGCGPADILSFLPDVDYVGYDISADYIEKARQKYPDWGEFHCRAVAPGMVEGQAKFDVVTALGVLHHLTDDEAKALLEVAKNNLKPGGHLVTFDGVYVDGQSRIARWMLDHDRGNHVRYAEEYVGLAKRYFATVDVTLRDDMLRLPYNHCIMVCEL